MTCPEYLLNIAESSLCLMEGGYPVCYCVPDYHGEKCEYQYDECKLSTAV